MNTQASGMSAIGALPFPFCYRVEDRRLVGLAMIPMEGTNVVNNKIYDTLMPATDNMNIVL